MLICTGNWIIRTECIRTLADEYEHGGWLEIARRLREIADETTSNNAMPPVLRLVLERWHAMPARRGDIEEACRLILKDICGDRAV